jgi:DNA-directed RNA polymerase specialized sigma24 family protein
LVARNFTSSDRTQLENVYQQWRDGGNGAIGDDLHIAIWQFATKHVETDLAHDVYIRVVRHLDHLRGRQATALPENLCAYLYVACRNALRDLHRYTHKYVHKSMEHLDRNSEPFNFWEFEADTESVTERCLLTLEKCRTLLPRQITELLDLGNLDLLHTLRFTDDSYDAVKKRRQRAKSKCLVAFGAAALMGYPTPQPLSMLISRLCPSLRGGPWERILAIAPRFRDFSPEASRVSAAALVEAAQNRLSTFVRGEEDLAAFKAAYNWLRTATLLCPEVAADSYGELKSSLYRYRGEYPLIGRLLDRIYALSGNETAAVEGNRFWHECLAGLRGDATYITDLEARFGAVYVLAYYAEPRLGWPLLNLLHPLDWRGIEQFLQQHASRLRDRIIAEACANVTEDIYQIRSHAEANFVRVQLGLTCLARYNPCFGKGYARLTPDTAMELAIIADHTARTTHNRQLKQTAEKIRGSLMYAYDLKWREFLRRSEHVQRMRHV